MATGTHGTDDQGASVKRRHFVRGLAGLGAAGAAGIVSADPAAAADGDVVELTSLTT